MANIPLTASLTALTATLASVPSTAAAQSVPAAAATTLGWSKTSAILGGAPSALQAILAQQKGQPATLAPVQPASYSAPLLVRPVLRDEPDVSPGVLNGRPDVFGSVALKVGRTPLTARWRKVENAALGGAAGHYAQALKDEDKIARLAAVNRYVNHRVRFVDDERQYGRADVWAAAADTLSRGRGDCEDYAIAKYQMLRRAGIADRDLYLSIVRDLITRQDHAVLVVRAAGHMFVLDNGTDRLVDSETIRDYRPILTFAATGTWTHGYRVHATPVAIASADQPSSPVTPAEDYRSRSASLLAFNTGFSR